jgi:hypothetical protein
MYSFTDTFKQTFNELDANCLDRLSEIYGEDVHFQDPVREIRGLDALSEYYANLYQGVLSCRFDYEPGMEEATQAVIPWVMRVRHGRFCRGQEITLSGMSHIQFTDRVHRHRDYFDMGEFIYERVPVLGGIIRRIKARL